MTCSLEGTFVGVVGFTFYVDLNHKTEYLFKWFFFFFWLF